MKKNINIKMKLYQTFLIIALSIVLTNGSTIHLNVSPATLTPLLTKSMTLKCAIGDDIGDAPPTADDADQSQTRSFRTMNQLQFVSSIVISREGKNIASISEHFSASRQNGLGDCKVNGSLAGSAGELALTCIHPTSAQEGNYTCEVTGFDQVGHSVSFLGTASIEQSPPTIDDLVSHIYTQELSVNVLKSILQNQDLTIVALESKFHLLESQLKGQIQKNNMLESKLNNQELCCLKLNNTTSALEIQLNHQETNLELLEKKSNQTDEHLHRELEMCKINNNKTSSQLLGKITILESKPTVNQIDLTRQLNDMQKDISDNTHIESGVVSCPDLGTASGTLPNDPSSKDVPVTFSSPYFRPPHVAVAVKDAGIYKEYSTYFSVNATNVTSGGFTVNCGVPYAVDWVRELHITWVSHP